MPKSVTSLDVAKRAGVSRSAVSRTFTSGASVSAETREKVIKAASELGYRVNYLARSLINQRSDLVGLVASNLDNPFRVLQIEHLSRCLLAHNLRPILLPAEGKEDPAKVIEMVLHYNVSGVIITSDTPPEQILQECHNSHVPLVLINKGPSLAQADRILLDNQTSAQLAFDTLAQHSVQKIGFVGTKSASYSLGIRRDSFLENCQNRDYTQPVCLWGAFQDYQGGIQAAKQFMALAEKPDGLFIVCDYMALGFIDYLRQVGGPVIPDQLKIIACDDIPQADWLPYQLTTIRQDTSELANRVVQQLLHRMLYPENPAQTITVPVTLIKRHTA